MNIIFEQFRRSNTTERIRLLPEATLGWSQRELVGEPSETEFLTQLSQDLMPSTGASSHRDSPAPSVPSPRRRLGRSLASSTIVAALMLLGVLPALASPVTVVDENTFTFTASEFVRPPVAAGSVFDLGTFDVPAHLVGQTCLFSVRTQNGESVHVQSYATILTNGNATDVLGTEDGVNGVHVVDRNLELGPTITVTYTTPGRSLGEQPLGVSVDLTIGVSCQGTATTTSSSTTTTTPPATGSTTSTSVPPATTTSVPIDSTTTTRPPRVPPGDDTPPTPPTTVPPITSPPTLPLTGFDDVGSLALLAGALILLGGSVAASIRLMPVGKHEAQKRAA